jgi:hypothetical protein
MADWSEFDKAVSSARASDLVSKRWADAVGGSYGGANAGPVESYGGVDEAMASNSRPRQYSPTASADAPGSGENMLSPGPRGDRSVHAHFGPHNSGNFDAAVSAVCGGDAQISKLWPDAQGGALGSTSDGYKD